MGCALAACAHVAMSPAALSSDASRGKPTWLGVGVGVRVRARARVRARVRVGARQAHLARTLEKAIPTMAIPNMAILTMATSRARLRRLSALSRKSWSGALKAG